MKITNMKKSAQVVLINKNGEILGVSRKDNHNDFGLAGGKVDPEDVSEEAAAIREVKEETGLDISNLVLIFAMCKDGYMGYTYLADYSGEIKHNEPHVVKWVPLSTLVEGSFGKWNKLVGESLTNMGIKILKAPRPKNVYLFAVMQEDWEDYPHVTITSKKYWDKHDCIPESYSDKEWEDISNICDNGDIKLSETEESIFEVSKGRELLTDKKVIIEEMVKAGFTYDKKFDDHINDY